MSTFHSSFVLRRSSLVIRHFPFLLALILSASSLSVQAAPLAVTSISLNPAFGPPGTVVTINGSDYTPGGYNATIRWDGVDQSTFFIPNGGSFSVTFNIPGGASVGTHTITVCAYCDQFEFEQTASANFNVTPAMTNTPTAAPPPAITSFTLDASTIAPGSCTTLRWTTANVTEVHLTGEFGTVGVAGNASREVCPPSTQTYTLDVLGYPSASPPTASANVTLFVVATPTVTLTPRPLQTRTPTPTLPPDVTPTLTPTPGGPPSECGELGLGPDAAVIDFESFAAGTSLADQLVPDFGVRFENSAIVRDPDVAAHSGVNAVKSHEDIEFGSFGYPIRMYFTRGVQAVGMFVGLDRVDFGSGDMTATLRAFGKRFDEAGAPHLLGTSAVSFPGVPTPIEHCVMYQAAEGEYIAYATLEYADTVYGSSPEARLMDDLTLVYTTDSLPADDRPPVVEITEPMEGASITVFDFLVRANIHEDQGLSRVTLIVNGTRIPTPVAFLPANPDEDPTLYSILGVHVTASMLRLGAENSIAIEAEDLAGLVGRDTITIRWNPPPTITPTPSLDIQAANVEIVQVVQCMNTPGCRNNSVPLIAGKPTLIRVYVRAVPAAPAQAIFGRLCRGWVETCETDYVPSFNSLRPENDADPVAADRGDLTKTLNFLLPPHWVRDPARLEFTVFVNYQGVQAPECCLDNNFLQRFIDITPPRTLSVGMLRASVGGLVANRSDAWGMVDWMQRVFPVSRIAVTFPPSDIVMESSLNNGEGDGCGRDWNRLLGDVGSVRGRTAGSSGLHFIAMVGAGIDTGGILGCGAVPGWDSASIVTADRFGGQVEAQELAHNKGLTHAPGCGADRLDPRYPVMDGTEDEWGVDVGRMQLYPPNTTFDYMGYCGGDNNTWTSVYTYRNMIRELPSAREPGLGRRVASPVGMQTNADFLFLGGVLYPNEVEIRSGLYRLALPADSKDDQPDGLYTVELLDASGGVLVTRNFGPTPLSNSNAGDSGTFFLILPAPDNAHALVIRYSGNEIRRLTASANPPVIQLTSPQGGERWEPTGEQTVTWDATDPDGDPLMFHLQLSYDGGQTWTAASGDLVGVNSHTVMPANLPGGNVLLRVLATDGFHTAEARTGAALAIATKGPEAFIGSPVDGDSYAFGWPVVLRGFATDLEDGPISDDTAFAWSSSLDGDLGLGHELYAEKLSAGEHEITLSVKDSEGQVGTYAVKITILQPTEPTAAPPSAPGGGPSRSLLIGGAGLICAALGLGLIAIAIFAISRRRR